LFLGNIFLVQVDAFYQIVFRSRYVS
jgi:hypothetical protein